MDKIKEKRKGNKICKVLTIIWSSLIFLSWIPFNMCMILHGPDLNSVEYYSDSANYVSFDVSVQSFFIDENYIGIKFDHSQKEFYDFFKIDGKNFDLAMENCLPELLQKDAVFTITSASAYLGDGWAYPVVALTYGEKVIIPYEAGRQNNIEVQRAAENQAKRYIMIWGIIFGTLAVFDVCSIIGIFLQRKKDLQTKTGGD